MLVHASAADAAFSHSTRPELAPVLWQTLEDPEGQLDESNVRTQPPERWRALDSAALSPGQSASAWWLRTTLSNPGGAPVAAILELTWPLLDWLDVWLLEDGQVREVWHTGDRRPFDSRPLDTRTFAFPLEIPPDAHRELLLRVRMDKALFESIKLQLWVPDAFWSVVRHYDLWAGLYGGVLLGIGCYNLLLFLSTRDRTFLRYSVYIGTVLLTVSAHRGYGFELLWPTAMGWQSDGQMLRTVLVVSTATSFVMSFLNTRERMPWLHRLMQVLLLIALVSLLGDLGLGLGLSMPVAAFHQTIHLIISVMFLIFIAAGARAYFQGIPEAGYFLLAWCFPILGANVFVVFYLFQFVPKNSIIEYSFDIGTLVEAILLAFAVGNRFQRLHDVNQALSSELMRERTAREEQRSFLATVAHELRTPLSVIDLTMQNLARGAAKTADALTRRRHDRVLEASRQLASLLSLQLDGDRLALDGQTLQRLPCDPDALLREAAAAGRLTARGHRVRVEATSADPILCDPDLTRLVLRSLADNAVKYTPSGTEVILRSGRNAVGDWLEVRDTGPGLSADELTEVFKPQVRGQGSTGVRGTGMGLTLARRLIECQGGTLTASSTLGAGCVFRIELPTADA